MDSIRNEKVSKIICPLCDMGTLEVKTVMTTAEYGGVTRELPLMFSECDHCGSETTDAEQSRFNKRQNTAFRKQVDGFLAGAEVRALRDRLGITQTQAAQIFGGGPVAFSKYESDDVMQSEAMDKLLRAAGSVPGMFEFLSQLSGASPVVPEAVWQDLPQPTETKPSLRSNGHLRLVVNNALPANAERERRYG